MVDGEFVNTGRNLMWNRAYKDTPDYSAINKCKLGVGTTDPTVDDIDIENGIPISYGDVNDNGDNQMIGSSGGDNTTDNTDTYKIGAGQGDDTSQNLIANNTNSTKIWTISDLSNYGNILSENKRVGLWLYIKDSTTLNKFATTGTCLEIRLGSSSSDYYNLTYEAGDLSTSWNWLTSNTDNLGDLNETGTVSGDIDYFEIEITTNNSTDTFAAGDVCYDLLRQWEISDMKGYVSTGYPTFDEDNEEVTIQYYIHSLQANGFMLSEVGSFNNDSTMCMADRDTFTPFSKSRTDEVIITITNKAE
jgi:hypothetical protein